MIGALWKLLNVLLVYLGRFLWLQLQLLLGLLGYDDWTLNLRSCMMHMREYSCVGALDE
jgi:hypothetical protein